MISFAYIVQSMPANPLTPSQRAEAALLKSIFKEWQNRQRDSGNKVSQETASELLGFGQSALSQYLNGRIPLNLDAATKIAAMIECAVSDFSETLAKQAAKYAAPATVAAVPAARTNSDDVEIPQYLGIGGSMGRGIVLQGLRGEIHSWRVTPEWVSKNVRNHSGVENLCIVTGFGPSMLGMFNPGDPLLVDRGVKSVDTDAVYFFRVGEEGFIKSIQRVPGVGLRAISRNPEFETWTITPDMDFEVLARVIKVWKSEDVF
ncbi:helix-turn-helix transcriptional regulator [Undibacterium arcticum]|uniref:LexA family transcriptional regulator n=1 Tax=Undibacterium arcticum TaxID=1762892 RepID=UPI003619BBC0